MTRAARRARGSIERRGGSVWLRIRHRNGERLRIFLGPVSELRSDAAARRAADLWLARNRPWDVQPGQTVLFGTYAEKYLRLEVPRFRKSSQRRYRSTIRKHLASLASVPLGQLTEQRVQVLLLQLGQGRRRATVMGIRAVLLQILRRARAEGLDVARLDQRLILPPRDNRPPREPGHITAGQLQQIVEASEDPWRSLWATLGFAGLRCGEALALTWDHVDLVAGALRIRQSVSLGAIAPTKTRTSQADVPIAPPLEQILANYRERWQPNAAGLLWANRDGRPLNADRLRERRWKPLLTRLGLPVCGLHALRHGTASRLFELGLDAKAVQAVMRHQSLTMTDRYSHRSFEQLREAVNRAYRSMHP